MLVNSKRKRLIARQIRFKVAFFLNEPEKIADLPITPLTALVERGLASASAERRAALAEFAMDVLTPEVVQRAVDLATLADGRHKNSRQIVQQFWVPIMLPQGDRVIVSSRKIAGKLAELIRRTLAPC